MRFLGDESLACELQTATSMKTTYTEIYTAHPHMVRTAAKFQIPEDVLWHSLFSEGSAAATNCSLFAAVRKEGLMTSRVGEYSSMLHVCALSTVLQVDIVSLCPSTSFTHRSLLNARTSPVRRTVATAYALPDNDSELGIMWSRDDFELPAGLAVFELNHAVPLFRENDGRYHFVTSRQTTARKTGMTQSKMTSFIGTLSAKIQKLNEPDSQVLNPAREILLTEVANGIEKHVSANAAFVSAAGLIDIDDIARQAVSSSVNADMKMEVNK
jgi:hypothetical protein